MCLVISEIMQILLGVICRDPSSLLLLIHVLITSRSLITRTTPFSGRQHLRNLQFCYCESSAETLATYNLWPGSPRHPNIAFSIDLLKWLYGLQMESQVSVKGFCDALKARSSKHDLHMVIGKVIISAFYSLLLYSSWLPNERVIFVWVQIGSIVSSLIF